MQKRKRFYNLTGMPVKAQRAASLTGYGLVVGLIAILAIVAVRDVGDSVEALFLDVSDEMETASLLSGGGSGSGSGSSSSSGASSGGAEEDTTPKFGQPACPSGDLSEPADVGCARLFSGGSPTNLNDVGIYAGDVPNGSGTDLFVRRCDLGMTYSSGCTGSRSHYLWRTVAADSILTDTGSEADATATDGPGNTAVLVGDGSATYPAAEACDALGSGWYLPAIMELDVIYSNLVAGEHDTDDDADNPIVTLAQGVGASFPSAYDGPLAASFDYTGAEGQVRYWSSSDHFTNGYAWLLLSDRGAAFGGIMEPSFMNPIRCARRS